MESASSLPPLLSMIIDGLPPMQQSEYVYVAEELLHQFVDRHHRIISFDSYCRVGLSLASYLHPKIVSLEHLVAISVNYALVFLLDDLFIDSPNPFLLDQYGIDRSACETLESMLLYLDHLDAVFSQHHLPHTRIETIMWECGHEILRLSNRDWFDCYVQGVKEHRHISVASHADLVAGRDACFKNLELYTGMRAENAGGKFIQLMMEFANSSYIPSTMRSNEFLENVTSLTSIHMAFANDVLSYHKEISQEANPRNLITVLMECEGKPVVESMHRAVELVNEYGRMILEMEAEAPKWGLEKHMENIKELIAGTVYFGYMDMRYRQADSIFPEQRDMSVSWKIAPRRKVSMQRSPERVLPVSMQRMGGVEQLQVENMCTGVKKYTKIKGFQIKSTGVKQFVIGCIGVKQPLFVKL